MALVLDRYPEFTYDGSPPEVSDLEDLRLLRKWEAAIGYRIFAALRWGQIGDGQMDLARCHAKLEAAKEVEASLFSADNGWRVFQWLARDLVPDPSVVLG